MKGYGFVAFFVLLALVLVFTTSQAQEPQSYNFNIEGRFFYGDDGRGPITGVCSDSRYLYVMQNHDSLRIFDISSTNLPTEQIGSCAIDAREFLYKNGNLLVATGLYEYWSSFAIIDLSDIRNPRELSHNCCHVEPNPKIIGHYLYLPYWSDIGCSGLEIFDISDPSHPTYSDVFCADQSDGYDFDNYGNTAYMTNSGGHATDILDISDPTNTTKIGEIPVVAGAVKVCGKQLFLGPAIYPPDYSGRVRIYDLSNPGSPASLLTIGTPHTQSFSIDVISGYLYLNGFGPEGITVLDVGGFATPETMATFMPGPVWPTQIAVKDNIVYYAAGDSGLYVLNYTGPAALNTGDANSSGAVNGLDVIYLANYLKYGGDPPGEPQERGDTNGDCILNGLDIVYLVNFLKGGPPPVRAYCYGH